MLSSLKQYEKQQRKPPKKKYYVRAPEVQIDFNAFKCKVDQFNKVIHEYTRIGMPVYDKVTVTQGFIAIFTQQAYTYYNFTAEKNTSQLDFHERVIKEIYEKLGSAEIQRPFAGRVNAIRT